MDHIIVQHMEPDHSGSLAIFAEKYPNAKIHTSAAALNMMKQFFGADFSGRTNIIKEGNTLKLGAHELQFISAPMVHWPGVMMTYDKTDKILFSADGFG